jgi:hypothetical protein
MDPIMNLKQARKLLSEQEDFRNQPEWLAETVTNAGYLIDFYPKYNNEFNYIETFWGAAKAWCRANCTFTFKDHVKLVPKALESVTLCKIRKFARKSYRYMDAYRVRGNDGNSLSSKMIEYAVKKYRGHRVIPYRILENDLLLNTIITERTLQNCAHFSFEQIETNSRVKMSATVSRKLYQGFYNGKFHK